MYSKRNELLLGFGARKLFPNPQYEKEIKNGIFKKEYFWKRDYAVRYASINDIEDLLVIEDGCWAKPIQATREDIMDRLNSEACTVFLMEYQGRAVGAMYVQRTESQLIKNIKVEQLTSIRRKNGSCIQCVAINIMPEYQNRGWGYELLEFVLQYASLYDGVNQVYAVTRCRDFEKSNCKTLPEYMKSIYKDGIFSDPIIRMHQLHGAKIAGLIKNYRVKDTENQGYGVLVSYDIEVREWHGKFVKKSEEKKVKNPEQVFLEYIANKLGENPDQEKTLNELGFDSLDFAEILIFIQEKLGIDISMQVLSDKSLGNILKALNPVAESQDMVGQSKTVVPLKKHIRSLMRKYPEIVPLSLEGEGKCTFWIHPLSGDVGIYNAIAEQLNGAIRMIAIKAKGFLSENREPIKDVKEMAAYYCEIITAIQPEGPYCLAGFSFGGIIAYEIARQLQKQNQKVESMLLVEAPFIKQEDAWLFKTSWRNNLIMNANFLLLALLNQKQGMEEQKATKWKIKEQEVHDIPDSELIHTLASMCKQKGLRQSEQEIEFKIESMAKVHISNLTAIQSYEAEQIPNPDEIQIYQFRTRSASAISKNLWNPDYLERIQEVKGSMLPLMEEWKRIFHKEKTILLDGENHFDVLHNTESIQKFTGYLKEIYGREEKKEEITGIAIIGLSGRFPDADNTWEFWDNLAQGKDSVRKMPDNRGWSINDYYDPSPKTPAKTYAVQGGFLKEIDKFDPLFFKISPKDAEMMEPSERIFIEEAWKAIEDAGYNPANLGGKKWGVYACAKGDYHITILNEDPSYYMPTDSYSAARLSYLLNLTGPAMTMDTACSSTLTVVAEACNNLILGNCEVAVAGGGSVYATPNLMIGSCQSLLLSPDGICYAFDERANGTVVGESIGAVVLKPLKKAVEDKDHIYGVIRGWEVNQDGKTNGITSPSGLAQTGLQTRVYEKFSINPEDITYVEAHGTGTKLGDSIEFHALNKSFSQYTNKKQYCAIGSVKTNIGHGFFGSGIASISKVLLSLKNRQIPATLHHVNPAADMDFSQSPFYINSTLKEWETQNGKPRLAAINGFGATGTNVHLVVEEYSPDAVKSQADICQPVIIVLTAKNADRLRAYAEEIVDFLKREEQKELDLLSFAYTLQASRDSMEACLGFCAHSRGQILKYLQEYISTAAIQDGLTAKRPKKKAVKDTSKEKEIKSAVMCWNSQNKADELLKLWSEGIEINWNELYVSIPEKMSIPAYPFVEERCWIETTKKSQPREDRIISETDINQKLYLFKEVWEEQTLPLEHLEEQDRNYIVLLSGQENQEVLKELLSKNQQKTELTFIEEAEKRKLPEILETKKGKKIAAVLYLWALDRKQSIEDYENIVALIQNVHDSNLDVEKIILAANVEEGSLEECYAESLIGFERSLGTMVFNSMVKAVLFSKSTDRSQISRKEILKNVLLESEYGRRSVCYYNQKRYQLRIQEQKRIEKNSAIRMKGTYLITGGFGKLAVLLAKYLAKNYQANLILCGRSTLNEEKKKIITELEGMGASVYCLQADVSDKEAMRQGIDKANAQFGTIHGVIHTAGEVDQKLLFQKKNGEFQNVLRPKQEGILTVDEILKHSRLDFICLFSSTAAILGDFGACDYAVGNRFLMDFAKYRNQLSKNGKRFGKTIAVNWPLWRDGGMGIDENEAYLETSGQRYLETQEGMEAFEQSLKSDGDHMIVMVGDKTKIDNLLETCVRDTGYQKSAPRKTVTAEPVSITGRLENDIKGLISQVYHLSADIIEKDEYLSEYGFDSINLFEFAKTAASFFNIELTSADLLGLSTVEKMVEYLEKEFQQELILFYQPQAEREELRSEPEEKREEGTLRERAAHAKPEQSSMWNEPIAVIGMSGRFPDADNTEEFWNHLIHGEQAIREVPKDRWNWEEYYGDPNETSGKTLGKWGGFLNRIDEFDPAFFKISPKEAALMDPCQRVFLEECWHALEDAGLMGERIKGKSCGVYAGAEEGDYGNMVRQEGEFYSNQNAVLSAQIAYMLDLDGPNMSITASCSSSLAALHQACQALRMGECDVAIAGGVNLFVSPMAHIGMGMLDLLSPTGKSHVFDEQADGMVPGEAVACVVLKPLSKAVQEGDYIYGCIKGSGINYSGRGNGMMAPNPERESKLMKRVMEQCSVNPDDIQVVMTHSVGSVMGDAAEINAWKKTLKQKDPIKNNIYFSSVKHSIGHTFAASGIVSLIAVLLSMQHEMIPGIHNYQYENKELHLDGQPIKIVSENKEWIKDSTRRRLAAVGTTANSGTNAFAIIEDFIPEGRQTEEPEGEHVFVFSAATKNSLHRMLEEYTRYLNVHQNVELNKMAYTLQTGREHMKYRALVIASNLSELLERIQECSKSVLKEGEWRNSGYKYMHNLIPIDRTSAYLSSAGINEAAAIQWLTGEKMDWEAYCQENSEPERIPLPGYPFEKEQYWIVDRKETERKIKEDRKTDIAVSRAELFLVDFFSDRLGISKEELDKNRELQDYGVNSILMMKLMRQLMKEFAMEVSSRDLINYNTIVSLASFIEGRISTEGDLKEVKDRGEDRADDMSEDRVDDSVVDALEKFIDGSVQIDELMQMIGED